MKRNIIALLLVICVLFTLCGCGRKPDTIEGPGFESPEDAIVGYAEALKTGDMNKILSVFAIESFVENVDMEDALEVSSVYTSNYFYGPVASVDSYTTGLNIIHRQYNIVKSLTYLYLSLSDMPEEGLYQPVAFSGQPYEDPGDLVDDIIIDDWMEILEEMEIGDIVELEDLPLNDVDRMEEETAKLAKTRRKLYGCDKWVPLGLEVELNGTDYYLCADLICYEDKWYVATPFGHFAVLLNAEVYMGGLYALED